MNREVPLHTNSTWSVLRSQGFWSNKSETDSCRIGRSESLALCSRSVFFISPFYIGPCCTMMPKSDTMCPKWHEWRTPMWAQLLFCNYFLIGPCFWVAALNCLKLCLADAFGLSDLCSRSCTEAYYLGFSLTVQLFEELVLRSFCFSYNWTVRQTRDGSFNTGLGGLCVTGDEYDAMQVPIHSLYLGLASSLPPSCYRISH